MILSAPADVLRTVVPWSADVKGCQDLPAEFCDVDHTVLCRLGPTHPCNLKCLCRTHYRRKALNPAWRPQMARLSEHPLAAVDVDDRTGDGG